MSLNGKQNDRRAQSLSHLVPVARNLESTYYPCTIIFDCTLATGYGFIRCYPSFVQWVPSKFQTEIHVLSKLCVTNCI